MSLAKSKKYACEKCWQEISCIFKKNLCRDKKVGETNEVSGVLVSESESESSVVLPYGILR